MKKTDKEIEVFIDWLGFNYLHFQNEGKDYRESVSIEITEKLKGVINVNPVTLAAEKVVYEWLNAIGEEQINHAITELAKALKQINPTK